MSKFVTPKFVLGMALLSHLLSIQSLWGHTSVEPTILGQYSTRYFISLVAHIILTLFWVSTFVFKHHVMKWIRRLSSFASVLLVAIPGIFAILLWFIPIESQVKQYLALNWLFLGVFISVTREDRGISIPSRSLWLLGIGVVIILMLSLFTVLTTFPFSPDEAHWADYASTYYTRGGVYSRTWLMKPVTITPGIGWSVAGYGWALENIAFDIRTGRVWNYIGYIWAFLGIALITYRLYGRKAALISVLFAITSSAFIPVLDYRPDHQLAFGSVFIVLAAIIARQTAHRRVQLMAHFACGLLATLSLQLHAVGIAFAFGMSLFYVVEFLLNWKRDRSLFALLWFGLGALIGTGAYYVFNILPVGGLDIYLAGVSSRIERFRMLEFLTWPSLLEAALILSAFAFLLWRRHASDRLYLGLVACVLVGLLLFDTQGYRSPVISLYAIPIGTLFVHGFQNPSKVAGSNRAPLSIICLTIVMTAQVLTFVNWNAFLEWLQTSRMPQYAYAELAAPLQQYITSDDIVISTHLLIWTLPSHTNFVSVAGELTAMRDWGLTNETQVWTQLQPTVIIDIPNQMTIPPSLQTYMQTHQFVVCQQLMVQNFQVDIYRPSCESAT